jgi:hypothetical protein
LEFATEERDGAKCLKRLVGVRGFEPPAPASRRLKIVTKSFYFKQLALLVPRKNDRK